MEYMDTDASVPKADTRWYYRVSAINAKGTATLTSNVASVVTHPAVAPQMPTDLDCVGRWGQLGWF